MLFHCRVTPSSKFTGTHLYTWVERGTTRVKCLAHDQGHNAVPQPGLKPGPPNLECSTLTMLIQLYILKKATVLQVFEAFFGEIKKSWQIEEQPGLCFTQHTFFWEIYMTSLDVKRKDDSTHSTDDDRKYMVTNFA